MKIIHMNSTTKSHMTSSWKQKLFQLFLVAMIASHSLVLFAQQEGTQAGATTSSIRSSRSFTFDAILVVAFALIALTAICKAVRR